MSPQDASFLPPNVTPPDPPGFRAVALVSSIFMSVILLAFISFIGVEFLADMAGHPLDFGRQPLPPDIVLSSESDSTDVFKIPRELITPKHQTRMMGPEIVVIYTRRSPDPAAIPPDLVVDDARQPWEAQYGDNTWFARLQMLEGVHRVQVEESEAEFFVETLTSPVRSTEQWTWHRPHPDTNKPDRCYDCHERGAQPTDPLAVGRQTIGAWKGIVSCFDCHEVEQHDIRHAVLQSMPTDQCLRCHAMH